MQTCGEVLVQLLEAHGITTVFGIAGAHTVELYRGLPDTDLRHVTPRHEQGAGFMADGFARASGKPAACFLISGPGITNVATALGQAYSDSVPLLAVSSVNNSHELGLGEGRLHELPAQRELSAGLTAFSHTLMRPDELPRVLSRAFAVFNSARPRPVHIEIPLDVMTADVDHIDRDAATFWSRPGPDPAAIKAAADLLRKAQRPMVVLGGGAQDASVEAREFVERLGTPALTTINGKGILPPDHPLSLGSTLPQRAMLDLLRSADVVLAVGTELGETDTLLFDGQIELGGQLIRVDIDAQQLARNARPTVGVISDAALALRVLSEELQDLGPALSTPETVQARRAEVLAGLNADEDVHRRVVDTIGEALPGAILVGDSTRPVYTANMTYQPAEPRSFFNSSTGYGTLGYALPASLGAKLACEDRPVVALIGDGGLQFTVGELATAVELRLSIPIVVWNNGGYGEIKKYMVDKDIPVTGVDLHTPDLQTVARGYGCAAVRVESLSQFEQLLREAHAASGPTLIEIAEDDARHW